MPLSLPLVQPNTKALLVKFSNQKLAPKLATGIKTFGQKKNPVLSFDIRVI